MSLRKISFWVRVSENKPKGVLVHAGIYRSKKAAKLKQRKGQHLVQMEGFYQRNDGLVLNRNGMWVKP